MTEGSVFVRGDPSVLISTRTKTVVGLALEQITDPSSREFGPIHLF
jgi:hypothetical protein